MPLSLKIAGRFFFKSWLQNLIILIVISVGIGVQLFIYTVSGSASSIITDQAITYNEHLVISDPNKATEKTVFPNTPFHGETLSSFYRAKKEVDYTYFRTTSQTIMIDQETHKMLPIIFTIFDTEEGFHASGLMDSKSIVSELDSTYPYQAAIHHTYLTTHNLTLGDFVGIQGKEQMLTFQITKTVDLGVFRSSFNYFYTTAHEVTTQDPTFLDEVKWVLALQLKDPSTVDDFYAHIKKDFKEYPNLQIKTWKQVFPEFEQLSIAQVAVTSVIQLFISAAVFIVVVTVLSFIVSSKSKQIGILKAMGLDDRKIAYVFFYYALILGVIGGIIGITGGYYFLRFFASYMTYEDGTPRLVIDYPWTYFALSVLIIGFTVFIAALLSIRKANKKTIIELIKI